MLEISNLQKSFKRFAITDVNMVVEPSDYHILLGSSGAGKSVLLELIAGIIPPDKGTISLFQKDITRMPTGKRRTGLIFQTPALFHHYTVEQNIGYSLNKFTKSDRLKRIEVLAAQMNISHLLQYKTTKLSGGELQRVALARVIASDPLILLLDEPLSAIDTSLKADIRGLLRTLNNDGMPILHVTHDFEEAVALGSKISIIEHGQIVQTGTLEAVIENPRNTFTAGFSGERNFFKVSITNHEAILKGTKGKISIQLSASYQVEDAHILVKSNSISIVLHEPEMSNMNNFKGVIKAINPSREGYQVCIDAGFSLYSYITSEAFIKMGIVEGQTVWASFKASAVEVII